MKQRPIETRALPVRLTNAERGQRGQDLADTLLALDQVEGTAKEIAQDMKKTADGHKGKAKALAIVVRTGYEDQPVECEWHGPHKGGPEGDTWVWTLTRSDTGEELRSELASAEDLQEDLPETH